MRNATILTILEILSRITNHIYPCQPTPDPRPIQASDNLIDESLQTHYNNWTELHSAVMRNDPTKVHNLLDAGVEISPCAVCKYCPTYCERIRGGMISISWYDPCTHHFPTITPLELSQKKGYTTIEQMLQERLLLQKYLSQNKQKAP